ncbi:MAG: 4-(cytidine 5'-diphospho)-2-C-methyl-D-erythritol kinase [Bacteroidaceae bacterium]|nr:4-(cytidine 5'-diphospho)-2-C-methyl-D-erythritol kinase [Bacteroidaceae bacterium]
METKEIFPIAKINIGLYVTRRREDGYHDLETIFYPIPLHDNLSISPLKMSNAPYQLQTAGHKIEGNSDDNLIVKVYKQLAEEFDLPPLDIYLYKRIPMGAGLGGGSSDAAAMIKLLNETFDLGLSTEDMERRVARLGADCAFFVQGKPAFATGIGDILSPIELSLSGMHLVLVKPDIFVSTKEAYGDIVPATPEHDLLKAIKAPITDWRHTVSNNFEKNVFRLHPEIAAIKQTLYDMGAVYASMSGSGSTVFGLFQHAVEEAERVFDDCFVWQSKL